MDLCEECGFDYPGVAAGALPERLSAFGPRYATALGAVADPRRRPAARVWSPLEYTCHVRDVFRVQRERLALGLRVDAPEFVPMGRDELAVSAAYNSQDPAVVLRELAAAGDALAAAFAVLDEADLERTGVYPWPERVERTLLWLGRHTVHEGEHHLMDIGRAPSTWA
ncbi:DinB family protein [Dactylosporangium roseum]|uniref:DinB family protein n=1 Tax=Dactylosporangium roseum TaxID=47989 RepID=A0ABY5YWQ3_9ACTN|nr:DinB family protein [Dactylosporangium roseum]UWZ33811.1 DinB family protein [Dactylosporangium roseum]